MYSGFMNNKDLPIYLVSLKEDEVRRSELKKCFVNYYDKFTRIEAVDGRKLTAKEYYEKTIRFFIKNKKIMSPAELGCTLSHIKALESFLETGSDYALILEDDIIGKDEDIDTIIDVTNKLTEDSLLICGGQLDILSKRYRFGKETSLENVYDVALLSYSFIYGCCCYVVTRKSAQQILNYHSRGLTLADNWGVFFKRNDTKMYYTNILSHPENFENSTIEGERAYLYKKSLINKVFSRDFFYKLSRRLYFETRRLYFILLRYKKL